MANDVQTTSGRACEGATNSPLKVQTLHRAMSLLSFLANQPRALKLGKIARAMGLSPTTTHRLLTDLVAVRLVHMPSRGMYEFGPSSYLLFQTSQLAKGKPAPRPLVAQFAVDMESRLRANAHKGGWDGMAPHGLTAYLVDEAAELLKELKPEQQEAYQDFKAAACMLEAAANVLRKWGPHLKVSSNPSRTTSEAADVANFAMMVADVVHKSAQCNHPQ